MKLKQAIALCILTLVFWVGLAKLTHPSKAVVKYYESYTVQQGDTLYIIAGQYEHNDIRELIWEIEQANNTTALLQVGQKLKIPILEVDE